MKGNVNGINTVRCFHCQQTKPICFFSSFGQSWRQTKAEIIKQLVFITHCFLLNCCIFRRTQNVTDSMTPATWFVIYSQITIWKLVFCPEKKKKKCKKEQKCLEINVIVLKETSAIISQVHPHPNNGDQIIWMLLSPVICNDGYKKVINLLLVSRRWI